MNPRKYTLPLAVFLLTFMLLGLVQVRLERPIILLERFVKNGGWVEIFIVSLYGAFVAWKMQEKNNVPHWRALSWTIFSVFFFAQLAIGLSGLDKFLMTGKLHLPIPMMIAAGPVYRGQLSVMTILFLSTVILTGPAWCSHLCYFGAFDNLAARGKASRTIIKNKAAVKTTTVILIIASAIILRWLNVGILTATILAGAFGAAGILIMIIFSVSRKKMVHCIMYCPIGTIVSILKPVNPFRMYIDKSCTLCNHCTSFCKYDALNQHNIRNGKPGITCTLCGDCLAGCSHDSIKYGFFRIGPEKARNLYLIITITLHAACIAMARI